jgi:hypothetical protein
MRDVGTTLACSEVNADPLRHERLLVDQGRIAVREPMCAIDTVVTIASRPARDRSARVRAMLRSR